MYERWGKTERMKRRNELWNGLFCETGRYKEERERDI